jgi:hypothetical protein
LCSEDPMGLRMPQRMGTFAARAPLEPEWERLTRRR